MVATPSTQWIPSSRRNPCPVCERSKDGDCRISPEGDRVICHHPRELRPGEVVNGWAFTRNTSDDRAAHFVLDRPREASSRLRVVNGRKPAPVSTPVSITGPITLARLPEGVQLPDLNRERATYHYNDGQRTIRDTNRQGGKVLPFHREGNQAKAGAGPDPWPLYQQGLALAADGWVLELEGERCVGLAMAAGVVAISQPGHNHSPDSISARYRSLQDAGVPGVVYVSDHDAEGQRKAERCAAAAAAVGLPFLHLPASKVWPGIAEKGSIDDAPGTPAERLAAIEAAIATVLQADPLDLDALLGPAEEGKLRRPRKDKLTHALALVLPLRFNLLSNRIERNGEPIDGDFLGTLYLDLAETHGLDVAKDRGIDAAIRVARQNAYHPVRDYLENLKVCLSPEDWAALDLRCFGRDDPSGWGLRHLQRQLIGLVARAMRPGCELHTCLVLQSDLQGIGKSSLWKTLGGEWFSDSLGDLRDVREDRLQLHSAWIHEWGEIDTVMGKRESETLKRFLSCSRDDVRRPYGRGTEQLQRSCGIVGTTNRRDFIKDPTGNRRFPIIPITRVELGWIEDHRDAIWGSAMAAYRAGERWHYETEENAHLTVAAASFAAEDPLRDQLETWLEDHPNLEELPVAHALWGMGYGDRMRDREICRQVSTAFRSIGWSQTTSRRRYLLPNGERTDKATGWIRPT
jgi:hypothetical protein